MTSTTVSGASTPIPKFVQPEILDESEPLTSEGDDHSNKYRVEFFLAPWRRSGDKGPWHYLSIGVACSTYLFIVGGSLTYLVFMTESGQYTVLFEYYE